MILPVPADRRSVGYRDGIVTHGRVQQWQSNVKLSAAQARQCEAVQDGATAGLGVVMSRIGVVKYRVAK